MNQHKLSNRPGGPHFDLSLQQSNVITFENSAHLCIAVQFLFFSGSNRTSVWSLVTGWEIGTRNIDFGADV